MGDGNGGGGGGGGGSSGGAADSYIGSLISLTSKSEIRYEGILYTVDTTDSNIALQDVRSFGTEGRKKDGPQIPASDKVYDFIIFRGTDIKDLQVKSSPPARQIQEQQPHHDPAIISLQSQATPMAPPVAIGASGASTAAATADGVNPGAYSSILPSANYPSNIPPLYQSYAGLGSWAMPQIPPGANGSMGMPMYWPGYYRPPGGMPHLQQPSPIPFQPPPTLPPSYLAQSRSLLQQPLPAPTSFSPSLSTHDASQLVSVPLNLKDSVVNPLPTPLPELAASMTAVPNVASALQTSTLPLEKKAPVATLRSKVPPHMGAPTMSNPQPTGSFIGQSSKDMLTNVTSVDSTALRDPLKSLDAQKQHIIPDPLVVEQSTPREPIMSAASTSHVQSSVNQPLLPLPANSVRQRHFNQAYGLAPYMPRGRGRGRGSGNLQSHSQFMEEFDFTAMNEKFNKNEVWGELGKSDFREKVEGEDDLSEDALYEEEDLPRVPVYVKDDFFDSLSCDALDRGVQAERTKFSEQRKIDTETFGKFSVRTRGGRGGRGGYRGGSRGGYYGGRLAGSGGRGRSYPRNPAEY